MGLLRVRDLGKAYKRYARKRGRLLEWLGAKPQHDQRWVLRDISFEIGRGEAVGIVGSNGAGKSTLLKIISGTTQPTTGTVETTGSVSALLELGIGFHPEFTGRQNVYMAGSIRGLHPEEMARRMADIEAFAEIGDYLDQPIRTYSSGMHVRLAFSVATAIRPDILIIDEALSVGDSYFSHKSFDRIRKFRDEGTTLLFVSHSAGAVKTLCDRAILIDRGQLIRDDVPDAVLDYYNALIAVQQADFSIRQTERETGHRTTRSGSSAARIESVEMLAGDKPVRALRSGDSAVIRVAIGVVEPIPELTAGVLIRDRLGNDVFGTNTFHCKAPCRNLVPGQRIVVDFFFESMQLGIGTFSLTVALHAGDTHISSNFDWWDRALVFQVVQGQGPVGVGVCRLPLVVSWRNADAAPTPMKSSPGKSLQAASEALPLEG